MSKQIEVAGLVDQLLETTAGRLEDVAEEAGVSYSALYSWATGRRRPHPENLRALASVASRRADRLSDLADRLEALLGDEAGVGR